MCSKTRADVRTIAQTLGVRHILEGSVPREGNHLRATGRSNARFRQVLAQADKAPAG
ncbi:MAG TPA: hypothetical protein VGD47_04035 [Steroidobacteraceae bacterium]